MIQRVNFLIHGRVNIPVSCKQGQGEGWTEFLTTGVPGVTICAEGYRIWRHWGCSHSHSPPRGAVSAAYWATFRSTVGTNYGTDRSSLLWRPMVQLELMTVWFAGRRHAVVNENATIICLRKDFPGLFKEEEVSWCFTSSGCPKLSCFENCAYTLVIRRSITYIPAFWMF